MHKSDELTIGEVAKRTGVATTALRFYEDRGLIRPLRTAGNQRRYPRSALRLVSVIRAAQSCGLSLTEIEAALSELPDRRTPSKADWAKLSRSWRDRIEAQIGQLERLRDNLDGCIGCGCLSLRSCALFNPEDQAAELGPGPTRL